MKLNFDLSKASRNTVVAFGLAWFIFVVLIAIVGPLITIWALNTLFHTEIPLNFWTWFAVTWLFSVGKFLRTNNE